ncbi:MAG: protein translocase subunit SecDF, partial [Chitinophagaceae bacterium]|nr:protein translocase subunit SecDF [Chitinophagaceae bacterium]
LSFTWFVRSHEKKMEAKAKSWRDANFQSAIEKYPGNIDSQRVYQEKLDSLYEKRLRDLLDSTKDETVTYGINGAISYKRAKAEELNLGLDLQGGMSVTLEVEMTGLLKSLASNSKNKAFLAAIDSAEARKANSDDDFISLFLNEYENSKLEPKLSLAILFSDASGGNLTVKSSDGDVKSYIRSQASEAFNTTFDRLSKRIDQFGVAQPNINKDPSKGTINVELPGVKDKARVRANLQSTANLEFWELYTAADQVYVTAWQRTFDAFKVKYGGAPDTSVKKDSIPKVDSAGKPADTSNKGQTLAGQLGKTGDTLPISTQNPQQSAVQLEQYFQPDGFQSYGKGRDNKDLFPAAAGSVALDDTARMNAYLKEFRSFFPGDAVFVYGIPEKVKGSSKERVALYALKTFGRTTPKLDGGAVTDAGVNYNQSNKIEISMRMNTRGQKLWGDLTTANVSRPIAILLDNVVQTAPNVNEPILDGSSSITGNYTQEQATDVAKILKIGKLPAPAKIVQEQEVGPTLGAAAIRGGVMAFVIAFVVIFLLMLVYYNSSGWVTNIALILNLLFTVGILSGLGASLTAPGIAGLILTIGLAVDTNVIIKERIKEELTKGKGYVPAVNTAFKRSLPPILDGHITILLTAIILFYFGLGPVKGFATTQILGILLSLFSGILVSRWITDIFTKRKVHFKYFTSVSRKIFQKAKFNFIAFRKKAFVISFIVLAFGIASFFNGFDYGVEFDGGRSYTIHFFDKDKVDVEQVRADLKAAFDGESPIIKTIGNNRTLDITTAYMINETDQSAGGKVDSIVREKLRIGLKNHLPANITYDQFNEQFNEKKKYIVGSKTVLPTISDDLKKGAVKATIFAIIVIFLYIFIRFRDWRYSVGTIIALLHDVLVTLIVFSFARTIVPFPLEIDQHFIAAILTVIGFSMNEAVIIFDRIREDRRLYPTAGLSDTINRAINETLSRTIMTSLTVFLTILILFIFGGEVTRGFAFAMLVGVITGVYSSMFVAAPMLINLGRSKKEKAAAGTPTKS